MKRLSAIILFLTTILINSFADDIKDSLRNAEELYRQSKFEDAVAIYESIIKSGYQSDDIHFNLGNSYYKSGNFVKAIVEYERVLLLSPDYKDAKYNLDIARAHQVDKIEIIPEFTPFIWIKNIYSTADSGTWTIISIILFISALICIYFFLFTKSVTTKKYTFVFTIILILFSAVSFNFSYSQYKLINDRHTAIVISPSVTVKSSPDESGTDLFLIHEGLKINIEEKLDKWCKIKLSNGDEGWLKYSDIEII